MESMTYANVRCTKTRLVLSLMLALAALGLGLSDAHSQNASVNAINATVVNAQGTAPATDAPGPFKTTNSEYRLQAAVDPDVLASEATEIWGRVFWPTPATSPTVPVKKLPLLLFLHGNHGTCGVGNGPRDDNSCAYTNEGACPAGYVVTPNHEGYNYAAETLASWGYVVVSINANRGITCGAGDSDDWGLILARGRLVLKHLQLWNEWSTKGGAPSSLGAPDQFIGAVDLANVGLMGHSRGGEGARAALNLYRDPGNPWASKIPGLDIRAIYEIGAVDGQSNRVLDAPSVAWNQTLPLCDGDVSDLQGRAPFERMLARFSANQETESRPSPKSLTMVWGANHNYFNTEWQTSDSYGCAGAPTHKAIFDGAKPQSLEQQAIARQSMTAFFRAHVGTEKNVALAQSFDPAFQFPSVFASVGQVDRDFIPGYELAKYLRVDDFTGPTGRNPAGSQNTISNVKVEHDNSAEPPVANVSWTNAATDRFFQTNLKDAGQGVDASSFDFLDFRVGRAMDDAPVELKSPVDFSVQLVAADDSLSAAIAVSRYARLLGPPNDSADLTQTIRLPLATFGKFDLTKVRGVRFVFNKTAKARVRLAHVRFGVAVEKMTAFRGVPFSTPRNTNMMDARPAATTPADMILPGDSRTTPFFLSTPLDSTARRRASWMMPRKIKKSRALLGAAGIEMLVTSPEPFPVMDSLPVLNIENRLFPLGRFLSNGDTHTMIFTMSKNSYARLPQNGRAQIQYGLEKPTRVWELPDFSKAETDRSLERE